MGERGVQERPGTFGTLSPNCAPTLLQQNYSHWSLLCREEGTWFLAGIRDFSSDCLRPRAFHSLQTHSPWISHVARGAYLEDQLAWDWSPEGEETETQICPPSTEYGGEEQAFRA